MNYDEEILEFLAEPGNIDIALDVDRRVKKLKSRLHIEFWEGVVKFLEDQLRTALLTPQWQVLEDALQDPLKRSVGCFVYERERTADDWDKYLKEREVWKDPVSGRTNIHDCPMDFSPDDERNKTDNPFVKKPA